MPTNKPFFPNLRPVKKVVTAQGGILIRKERKCGNEFLVSKKINGSVVWVEAVEDIVTAKKRLNQPRIGRN